MSKKLLRYFVIVVLYFSGSILLQQCFWWSCHQDVKRVKDYQINALDWLVTSTEAPGTPNDTSFYSRTSIRINARLLDYNFVETASLWQPIPTALACSPPSPKSAQYVNGMSILLLDSLLLNRTEWLVPGTLMNAYFDAFLENYRIGTLPAFLARSSPRFESVSSPFSLQWNQDLIENTSLRLQIKMELSDGKRFETPENQPIQLNIY